MVFADPDLNTARLTGTILRCNIEGTLDVGYHITSSLAGVELRGVLFEVPEAQNQTGQFTNISVPPPGRAPEPATRGTGPLRKRRSRHKRRRMEGYQNLPKKTLTGYNFFFAEEGVRLRKLFPFLQVKQVIQAIGFGWHSLSAEQKQPYIDRSIQDKQRYAEEMSEYRKRWLPGMLGLPQPPQTPAAADMEIQEELVDAPAGHGDMSAEDKVNVPAEDTLAEDQVDAPLEDMMIEDNVDAPAADLGAHTSVVYNFDFCLEELRRSEICICQSSTLSIRPDVCPLFFG
ncbi:hypothetical protein R1sor_020218 [Riccia sorocarpa]|uniref:HMG box domain-containing protein n=1 Tax=Riccia sorocarpa TaxID=122646 RepID=A0ABD3IFV5_9MARC